MITFKQQITVPEELVLGFAEFLGYKNTLTRNVEKFVEADEFTPAHSYFETEEYDNPESSIEYVDRLAKEHTSYFFENYANKLVQDQLEQLGVNEQQRQAQAQIEEQIVIPVKEALSSEIIISE